MAGIQFKRGTAARWVELNPILEPGQPGYVTDENRLKIGDGQTAWNDLPYIGEDNVINANTHYDFPSVGKAHTVYKAESERLLYQWNTSKLAYEVVGEAEITGDLADIKVINGGGAVIEE